MIGRILKPGEFPKNLNWQNTQIVLVTGWGINTCGHVLLYVGGGFGHYFHFDGKPYDFPKYIGGDAEYRSYLTNNKKEELLRKKLDIPNPKAAETELVTLMYKKWWTLVVSHNCVVFVQAVIQAGGNFWSFPPQCPVLDMGLTMLFDHFGARKPRVTINK
jgi:hypothetical protein